jgi:hypothetical protein
VPTYALDLAVFIAKTNGMFLRVKTRFKDGKEHRYWSIVENRLTQGNRVVQRQVLYLGEINDSQKAGWCKTIEVFQEGQTQSTQLALFPEDRALRHWFRLIPNAWDREDFCQG